MRAGPRLQRQFSCLTLLPWETSHAMGSRCSGFTEVNGLGRPLKQPCGYGEITEANQEPGAPNHLCDGIEVEPDGSAKGEPDQRKNDIHEDAARSCFAQKC